MWGLERQVRDADSLTDLKESAFLITQDQLGEGNGNPLLYSCLENPVDGGAWWAAVHRVAQGWTQLKRLSMHACIGEGDSSPLQYWCLENPTDGGTWWAAQSRTRLKRLSSSNSSRINGWPDFLPHLLHFFSETLCHLCPPYSHVHLEIGIFSSESIMP